VSDAGIALCALAMALGLVGTLVPLLPGMALIWATALVFGLVDGFGSTGVAAFALITALAVAALVGKVLLPGRGARGGGAPMASLMIGALAGVVGFFVIPVLGMPIGAVLGVLVAEYRRTRRWELAWRSTRGVVVGIGLAAALEFGAGTLMVLAWAAWVVLAR
jgi:uncharacterized protein YqgC (DUF456 family)